jgi:hypothetical protein
METVPKQYFDEMESAYSKLQNQNQQILSSDTSMFASLTDDNLIRWQLDLKEDLDRIYHLLKGDQKKEDSDGNITYQSASDDASKPFNEFGVNLIMNIMSFYLNRNTLLSNYDEDTINTKVLDFGIEFSDLIHNKYEKMGLDSPEKIKMINMIVLELVDTVHSAYLRALNGGERDSLRTARHVAQTDNPVFRGQQPYNQGGRGGFSLFNPTTWGR